MKPFLNKFLTFISWLSVCGVLYMLFYPSIPIRYPVTCAQILEPFSTIPTQPINQDEFRKWIDENYKWRNSDEVHTAYYSPTYRIDWKNGNKWYLAHFSDESLKLIALEVGYGYHQIGSPRIDDVIIRNSQQPRLRKVIGCLGNPDYYVATTTDKHNIVQLWYLEKGMAIYASADKANRAVENFDVYSLVFLSEPTTLENMLSTFSQSRLLDFARDSESMKEWAGFGEIDFVVVNP